MPHADGAAATPVVFLHAFPLSATMWDGARATFTDRVTLAPDLPGFGGSAASGRTLDDFAAAAVGAMDAAGIDRAVVVGLSMGGYTAFRLFSKWPERVAALVLADTRAGADGAEAAEKRTRQAERARAEGVGWLADALLPALLGETTRRDRPEVVARVRRMIDAADPEGVARALEAMRTRPDSTPDLERIAVPVLAIVGDEDTLTPVEEAHRIADGVRDGRLRVIPGAGHLSNLEDPAAFGAALGEFLQTVDSVGDGRPQTPADTQV